MTWILILTIFHHENVAVTSIEFNNKTACVTVRDNYEALQNKNNAASADKGFTNELIYNVACVAKGVK